MQLNLGFRIPEMRFILILFNFTFLRENLKRVPGFIGRKILYIAFLPFSLLAVVLMRAIKPLILIRIGKLRSNRIGHFSGNTDFYLCGKIDKGSENRSYDFFVTDKEISNQCLKKLWSRQLNILWPTFFFLFVYRLNKLISGGGSHEINLSSDQDIKGYLERYPPMLHFNNDELAQGASYLKSLGMNGSDKYICFAYRDPVYLARTFSGRTWDYHNFRDSSVQNYVEAISRVLAQNDLKAFRMGSVVADSLEADPRGNIIDYASSPQQSDFLDLFISSECDLFLSGGSGFSAVPRIFRKPMACANIIPLNYMGRGSVVSFIPKKLWLRAEGRFLTFREIICSEIGTYLKSELYENAGIDVIENTPEEIHELLSEALLRVEGQWNPSPEDRELQKKFQKIYEDRGPSDIFPKYRADICTEFLRNNTELLD